MYLKGKMMIGLEYIAKIYNTEYKEIAEKIGVSQPTIQDWLKGRRKIPKDRLLQLINHFKIDEQLFQKELTNEDIRTIRIAKLKNDAEELGFELVSKSK
jgi:transcriptional regulator with XRE-family HTH domain